MLHVPDHVLLAIHEVGVRCICRCLPQSVEANCGPALTCRGSVNDLYPELRAGILPQSADGNGTRMYRPFYVTAGIYAGKLEDLPADCGCLWVIGARNQLPALAHGVGRVPPHLPCL